MHLFLLLSVYVGSVRPTVTKSARTMDSVFWHKRGTMVSQIVYRVWFDAKWLTHYGTDVLKNAAIKKRGYE